MFFRREAEPARRGEIKRARIARNFTNHTGQFTAFEPLFQCEQRIFGAPGRDMDHPPTGTRACASSTSATSAKTTMMIALTR